MGPPTFESPDTVKNLYHVGVDFMDFPICLWSSLWDMAATLGTTLFIPSNRHMGMPKIKCALLGILKILPNVGVGVKVIPLRCGTFFWACFNYNGFCHFARDCPSIAKIAPKPPIPPIIETLDLMVVGNAIKMNKPIPLESNVTPPIDKILDKATTA